MRNTDDDLIRRLEAREASHRRSVQAEHGPILAQAPVEDRGTFAARAGRWRARTTGREATDSAELIRADRDRDYRT